MPIDKKSLELLRALAKQGEMHRDQLNAILGEGNLSDHTTLLMKRGLIEPRAASSPSPWRALPSWRTDAGSSGTLWFRTPLRL